MKVSVVDKDQKVITGINFILFFMLLFLVFGIGLGCIYIELPEGDVMEHIYDTFMVSSGSIPYRDFFEHHHPLLWYIMVPLVRLLDRNVEIVGIADYITFCFFMFGLYFVYKLCIEFLSTKTAALLSLIYILTPNIFIYFVYFKPDNWLIACNAIGIYYYFKYIRDKQKYDLVIAFLLFFIGFLFIQKAILYYPAFGIWVVYALYKKEMRWKDFFVALILPVILGCGFFGYFYYHEALKPYFMLNFVFNSEMRQYFGEYQTSEPFYMGVVVLGAALFASVGLYKYENNFFRLYSVLFWLLFLEKLFYFSPHVYYWYEVYFFALPIAATGVITLSSKLKMLLYVVVLETLIYAGSLGYDILSDVHYYYVRNPLTSREFILRNTNRCDEWVGYGASSINLFLKTPVYYWFIQGELDVFGEKIGIHPVEDLNAIIEKHKPKVIYVDRVYERYDDNEEKRVIHEPDMKMIEKYYAPTQYTSDVDGFDVENMTEKKLDFLRGVWILKPEYQRENCVFDAAQKEWRYADE